MVLTRRRLTSREQTAREMYRLALQYWQDLDQYGLLDVDLKTFFNRVRRIPYREDPKGEELTARPAHLLDRGRWPALDCKKKAILIGAYLVAHGYSPANGRKGENLFRFVTISEKSDKVPHHILTQAFMDGKWKNLDPTYPEYRIFEGKEGATLAEEQPSMTELVTMEGSERMGHEFSLLKLMGADQSDPLLTANPLELSNEDAGIQLLYQISQKWPGVTWGDLMEISRGNDPDVLGKWKNPFKNIGRKLQNLTVQTFDYIGDKSGDAIRLLTDKEVRDGIASYGAAYATGGQSLALEGLFSGALSPQEGKKALDRMGREQKINFAQTGGVHDFSKMDLSNINPLYLAAAGGGVLLLIISMM